MKKGLKYIQFIDALPHVQSDFIVFKMSSAQFTNYFSTCIIFGVFKSTLTLINLLQSHFLPNIV